jgi:hypothetical protein
LDFVEVFLYEGNNKGQSSMLISIKHTSTCFLYIHTSTYLNGKSHWLGGERGREREGDVVSERGSGIQSERERGVDAREIYIYNGGYGEIRGADEEESERGDEY